MRLEFGLSGPGRLHDLFVTHEAMSPGEWKSGGAGLTLRYGSILAVRHSARHGDRARVRGLAFADAGEEHDGVADMKPLAERHLCRGPRRHRGLAQRIFDPSNGARNSRSAWS